MYFLSRNLVTLRPKLRNCCLNNKHFWGINWHEISDSLAQQGSSVHNVIQGAGYITKVNEAFFQASIKYAFWRQRMKEKWIAKGELPTPLLYSKVNQRQKKNEVLTIRGQQGDWRYGQQQV